MIFKLNCDNELELYNYFISSRKNVPYYYPVNFKHWHISMFNDCDFDSKPLFSDLETFLLINNDIIEGFIQFGLTSFVFGMNGEKDYSKHYGVIRNIYYAENSQNAYLLFNKAKEYFDHLGIEKRYAYFHYFGMSCYARQGKLHASEFYIENLLKKYGYVKEHENVYYSKSLQQISSPAISEIAFLYANNGQSISFMKENKKIGGCELNFVPHSDICFLKWIYIDDKYSHQGLGTKCMYKLFIELQEKGISKIDTDTADSNVNAQRYYMKMGFADMGRMRSYYTV